MTSFKGRRVNPKRLVEVYRNLHRGGYSVRQGGKVVAHSDYVTMLDAEFHVSEAGRQRVLKTGRRNVHAWARGQLVKCAPTRQQMNARVRYSPKTSGCFEYCRPREDGWYPIRNARLVQFSSGGVSAWKANDW